MGKISDHEALATSCFSPIGAGTTERLSPYGPTFLGSPHERR